MSVPGVSPCQPTGKRSPHRNLQDRERRWQSWRTNGLHQWFAGQGYAGMPGVVCRFPRPIKSLSPTTHRFCKLMGWKQTTLQMQKPPETLLQDCVDKAKKLIDDAIEKAKERTGQANPNACSVKVPYELIGMVIGRGGETIKDCPLGDPLLSFDTSNSYVQLCWAICNTGTSMHSHMI